MTLCQTYASVPSLGCTFASWEDIGIFKTCTLYKEPFASYLSHCHQLSGPPDTSGCSVENPEENSCDIIRYFGIWTITRKYCFWIVVTQTINIQRGRVCSARQTYRPHSKSECSSSLIKASKQQMTPPITVAGRQLGNLCHLLPGWLFWRLRSLAVRERSEVTTLLFTLCCGWQWLIQAVCSLFSYDIFDGGIG